MAKFLNELIFWINWLVALIATPMIWYCWFMALRIFYFNNLKYQPLEQNHKQDYLIGILSLIRLIRLDDNHQPYVPYITIPLLKSQIIAYCFLVIFLTFLVSFCYYGVSAYATPIPEKIAFYNTQSFDFIFECQIKLFLLLTLSGFIIRLVSIIFIFDNDFIDNLTLTSAFLMVFGITSLIIGSGVIWGIGYLIDVVRYK